MTTYKCRYCNGQWQEGPTRNYCDTEQCRKCANARICELEAGLRDALADCEFSMEPKLHSDLTALLEVKP